jgi:hypothetical protein
VATAPKPPSPQEVALTEAQNLIQLWLRTKHFYAKANTEEPVTREDEQQFLETKSHISRLQRVLGAKMPPGVTFGADRMQDLLRQSISIGHLRNLPKSDKQQLMQTWHQVFIYLSRAAGALQFMVEGYIPQQRAKAGSGTNIKEMKKAAGDKQAKPNPLATGKFWFVVLLLAGAAFGVWRIMNAQ